MCMVICMFYFHEPFALRNSEWLLFVCFNKDIQTCLKWRLYHIWLSVRSFVVDEKLWPPPSFKLPIPGLHDVFFVFLCCDFANSVEVCPAFIQYNTIQSFPLKTFLNFLNFKSAAWSGLNNLIQSCGNITVSTHVSKLHLISCFIILTLAFLCWLD